MAPKALGTITVDIIDGPEGRGIALSNTGTIEPTDLFLAAAHLTRIANQFLDAATMRAAESSDPKGIAVVRAMPDALRQ